MHIVSIQRMFQLVVKVEEVEMMEVISKHFGQNRVVIVMDAVLLNIMFAIM